MGAPRPRRRSIAVLHKQLREWNDKHPAGTEVIVTEDDGRQTPTKTRSEAWGLSHGDNVVLLEGRSGGYLLDRVRPAAKVG